MDIDGGFKVNLYSNACKEPSVSSTFVILGSILNNIIGGGCRQSSSRVRGVVKYKRKGTFKINEGDKYKKKDIVSRIKIKIIPCRDQNQYKLFSLLRHNCKKKQT